MPESFTLDGDVVAAVCAHMNDDHAADNVVIVRGVGECPEATAATMVDLTIDRLEFEVDTPAGACLVHVPFSTPITERAQIRAEVARMFHDSEALLADRA